MNGDIQGIILIIIAIVEFILGLYILIKHQSQKIPIYYSLFIFSVVIWVLSNGIFVLTVSNFWGDLAFVGAILLVAFFLVFAWVFPYEDKIIGVKRKLFLILPVIFFIVTLYINGIFIKEYSDPFHGGSHDIHGPIYYFFVVYILTCFIWGISVLINKFKKSDGIHRWQLKYFLIGIILSCIFGVTFNLILPLFGVSSYSSYGPASTIIWLGFTSYIILKK